MTKSRDSRSKSAKRAERQIKTAGKFPFHRAEKFKKMIKKILPWRREQ